MKHFCFLLLLLGSITPAPAQVQVETIPLDRPLSAWGGITLGPDGNLYVADWLNRTFHDPVNDPPPAPENIGNGVVRIVLGLDASGRLTGKVEPFITTDLAGPFDVAFDFRQELVVGNTYAERPTIRRYDLQGQLVAQNPTAGQPTAIAVAPDSRIFWADCSPAGQGFAQMVTIRHMNINGVFVAPLDFLKAGFYPGCLSGLAIDEDGYVYAMESDAFSRNGTSITRFIADGSDWPGAASESVARSVSFGGEDVFGLTYANGMLYTSSNNRIYQVTKEGIVRVLAGRGFPGLQDGPAFEAQFRGGFHLAASTTGDTLFAVNVADEGIGRFEPTVLRMITGVHNAELARVDIEPAGEVPHRFSLDQNYPNPFRSMTTIRYRLDRSGPVRLNVYDVLGRPVKTLVDAVQSAGMHGVHFDATGQSEGLYFYTLHQADQTQTRKMMLVR